MIKSAAISVNSFVESLQQQLNQCELEKLEYVFVTHSDNAMVTQLKEAYCDNAIAVISVPQNCWDMNDEQMDELSSWLFGELNVASLVLVGHSQGGVPSESVQVLGSGQLGTGDEATTNRLSSITARARYAQACVRQNEEHFVEELDALASLPAVQEHSPRGQQLVQGLFYRAECGLFCHFDTSSRKFRALMPSN